MHLWPEQVAALADIYEVHGLLGPLAVGRGKALVSLLAPVVLESKRPVLLVPASLRDQTLAHVVPQMRKHWKLHPNLAVVGYEELALAKNATLLETLQPDLVVCDEAHALRNTSAGRTRRVSRYLRENPTCVFVALSGTMTNRSLRDYWHLARWALRDDLVPLPTKWPELQDWADALDAVRLGQEQDRVVAPGALLDFCEKGEKPADGFRRRLVETPGVVASGEDELGVSLVIQPRPLAVPTVVDKALKDLRATWVAPNGDEITDALTMWRISHELALGLFYRWDPPAPKEWLQPRLAWNRYVREQLHYRHSLDTPLQVWQEQAKLPADMQRQEFRDWKEVRESFDPTSVAEWISDHAVRDATAWLRENDGLVWTSHDAFARRLSEVSGRPYFGPGAEASRAILTAKGPSIASRKAHGIGKNLVQWNRALVVAPPTTGTAWEQALGRMHRPGHSADSVVVDVYLSTPEQRAAFGRARGDALYQRQTTGASQKLCYATLIAEAGGLYV